MFLAKAPPFIGYNGNNKATYSQVFNLKDDLYNCLKGQKVW